jgi:hypothetical protein
MWKRETCVDNPARRGPLSASEDAFVRANLSTMTIADMARALGCSYRSIDSFLLRKGLYAQRKTVKRHNITPMTRMADTELAYLAGIVDGEGTITIARRQRFFRPAMTVANTSMLLVDWFRERGFTSHRAVNNKGRPFWRLGWGGYSLGEALKPLLPFLVIKRRHAELLIEFCEIRAQQRHRDRATPRMLEIWQEIQSLNLRQSPPCATRSRPTSSTT